MTTPAEAAAELLRRRRARTDLIGFAEYTHPCYQAAPHHRRIAHELEGVLRGEVDRLMLVIPPRHGKSELGSIRFPAFALGVDPSLHIISASATRELALDFGRQVRNLVASQEYRNIFPETSLAPDSTAAGRWHTNAGGMLYAVGVDGALLGRGADIAIVDDFFATWDDAQSVLTRNHAWDWYTGTLYNRLQTGKSRIVVIGHRTSDDDPQSRMLEAMKDGGDQWRVVELPAIDNGHALWPERFPVEALERIKRNTKPGQWSAFYMGDPTPEEGLFFKADWLRPYVASELPKHLRVYGASDYATKDGAGDFTVHAVVGIDPEGDMWLLDVWRKQSASDEWVEAFCDLVLKWKPIEWAEESGQILSAMGPLIMRRMRERSAYVFRRQFAAKADKSVRAQSIRGRMATNGLFVPARSMWYPEFRQELLGFPAAKHDDQVDTMGLIGQMLDHILPAWEPPKPEVKHDPYVPVAGGVQVNLGEVHRRMIRKHKEMSA